MPRQPRAHIDNAFYHVLARGNNKEEIFYRPEDFRTYLSILDFFGQKHGFLLHAFVLMPNHVHLLIQVGTSPLSTLMHRVQQTYTQEFNRRYSRVGHIFQGRFKALLVEDDSYLLTLIRYIHLNPVRAAIAVNPEDYPWTSHGHYATGKGPGRVHTDFVLKVLASFGVESIQDFDLLLCNEAQDTANGREIVRSDPYKAPIEMQFSAVLRAVAEATGVSPTRITGTGRDRTASRARHLLSYFAIHQANLKVSTLSRMLGCSSTAVTLAINKITERLDSGDQEWQDALATVETHFKKEVRTLS